MQFVTRSNANREPASPGFWPMICGRIRGCFGLNPREERPLPRSERKRRRKELVRKLQRSR